MPIKRKSRQGPSMKRRRMSPALGSITRFPPLGGASRVLRSNRMRVRKSLVSRNCHSFTRFATTTYRDLCTGLEQDGAMSFTFDDIAGYTDFTGLYDRYMIAGIQLRVRLVNNPNTSLALNNFAVAPTTTVYWNATNWFPRLYYIKDYDDDTAETAANLKERAKTKMIILKPNVYHKIFIKPAVLMQTYRTAATTGYAPKWNNWIDAAQTNVPHYGFKYALDTSA